MVIQVFVAERQSVDALRQHLFEAMLDAFGLPVVGEATGHAPKQADHAVGLTQQERAAFGGELAALKLGYHLA